MIVCDTQTILNIKFSARDWEHEEAVFLHYLMRLDDFLKRKYKLLHLLPDCLAYAYSYTMHKC